MSEHRDSSCQKYAVPKSLQGIEDAELIWGMIVERFPKAAPLLYDVEALVDKAEDLLQQLRVPCQHETETSASFHDLDSEGSSGLLSARESLSIDNDNTDSDKKMVGSAQHSESNIYDADIDSNNQSANSVSRRDVEMQSNNTLAVQRSLEEKRSTAEKSVASKDNTHVEQREKEARILEEWERVVDDAMRKSIEVEDSEHRDDADESEKCSNCKEVKENRLGSDEHEKACIFLHKQGQRVHVEDSTTHVDDDNDDSVVSMSKDSGDESSLKKASRRTPLCILEDFAKRCNTTVMYDDDGPNRRRSKVFVVRGSLCGFNASAQGITEESAKTNLAVKMLELIANWQMDDEKPSLPANFSKDEMLEIINIGVEIPRMPAPRRLYRLCLEQGQEIPTYSVEKMENSVEGLTYVATCSALGYTGEGRGVRDRVAKKEAASDLYRRYCQDQRSMLK